MALYDAYIFDVQGTLLDFFGPVSTAIAEYLGCATDSPLPGDLTRAWRADYFARVAELEQSAEHWNRVQDAYAEGLADVSSQLGLSIPLEEHPRLADAWRRLVPWPDAADGIRQLRERAAVVTLSNTDMATMIHLFKEVGIDWDAVLTAEVFGKFKPHPDLYLRTCRFLGLPPHRVAMVASHPYDLRAAKDAGLGTVFVYRPLEYGTLDEAVDDIDNEFDHRVEDIRDIP